MPDNNPEYVEISNLSPANDTNPKHLQMIANNPNHTGSMANPNPITNPSRADPRLVALIKLPKELLNYIKKFLPSTLARTVEGRNNYLDIYHRYLQIGYHILRAKNDEVQKKETELQAAKEELASFKKTSQKSARGGKWWSRPLKKTPIESNNTVSTEEMTRLSSEVETITAELKEKRDKFTNGFNMSDLTTYLSEVKEGDTIIDITTKENIKVLRIAKNQEDKYIFEYTNSDVFKERKEVSQSDGAVIISNYVDSQATITKNRPEVRLFLKLNEKFRKKYNKQPRSQFMTCNMARLKEEENEYNKLQRQVKAFSDKIQKMNIDNEVDDNLIREIVICYIKGGGGGIYKVLIKRFDWIPPDIIVNLQTDLMKIIQHNNFEKKDLLNVFNITEKDLKSKSRSLSCCDGDCNDASNEAHKPSVRFAAATKIHEFAKEDEVNKAKQTDGEGVHEENFSIPMHISHYVGLEGPGMLGEGRLAANKHLNPNSMINTNFWSDPDGPEAKKIRRLASIAARSNNSLDIQNSSSNLKGPGASKIRNILSKFIEDVEQKIKMKWEEEAGWNRIKEANPRYKAELDELCNEMWGLMYDQVIENITIAKNLKGIGEKPELPQEVANAKKEKNKESTAPWDFNHREGRKKKAELEKIKIAYDQDIKRYDQLTEEEGFRKETVMVEIIKRYNKIKSPPEPPKRRRIGTIAIPKKSAMKTSTPSPWEFENAAPEANDENNEKTQQELKTIIQTLNLPNELTIPNNITKLLKILHDMYNLLDTMYKYAKSDSVESQTINYSTLR